MKFSQRGRGIVRMVAVVLSLALPLAMAVSSADARAGGGLSSGSRGGRTFSAPPSTSTAPNTAQPFNRTITQPGSPSFGTPGGGFFNRPGLLGGLAAGFLGAGLLGMLFGGGLFGGIGGFSSVIGLLLQIALIVFLVRLAMSWWQRRHETATAFAGGPSPLGAQSSFRNATGFGLGSGSAPLEIQPGDYEAFERLLGEIQAAWSNEDIARLHTLATPEMVSYLARDIEQNKARNVVNKVSGTKLLQGDLAEAWREGDTDYATVAMRFSMVDKNVDRLTGRVVEGSDQPVEVTEVWTFVRPRGANWELSAIQQT
ncbi:MAG TPA: TIM44-like domain-containing protein [Bradyrhizobium sp.]|jgi:predicted lipid-binding transport protein (Tim44 family)|uniref:Tim44 domain-containing protein n=1 Tax=Bradyrhizobium sp. TaxID=376 RepID=UPI002B59DF35|nr:TIM44-like domain-containing protein [Bradyrhizobium sp.]HXB76316.1 TIM44-like domain-containing protein [Bradyrhizobium sp.]